MKQLGQTIGTTERGLSDRYSSDFHT